MNKLIKRSCKPQKLRPFLLVTNFIFSINFLRVSLWLEYAEFVLANRTQYTSVLYTFSESLLSHSSMLKH